MHGRVYARILVIYAWTNVRIYISGYISEYLPEYRSEIISVYEQK